MRPTPRLNRKVAHDLHLLRHKLRLPGPVKATRRSPRQLTLVGSYARPAKPAEVRTLTLAEEQEALRRIKEHTPRIDWKGELGKLGRGTSEFRRGIPAFLLRRMHTRLSRSYYADRDLVWVDDELRQMQLPTLSRILSRQRGKSIFFDVGAGEGRVGFDIHEKFPNTKESKIQVEYHAFDIAESETVQRATDGSERKVKVNALDVENDPLPRNRAKVVTCIFVLPYVPNKFKALANMANALKVGGVLLVDRFGEFSINRRKYFKDYDDQRPNARIPLKDRAFLRTLIQAQNPHLRVTVTEKGGILIRKISDGETRIRLGFLKSTAPSKILPEALKYSLSSGFATAGTAVASHYEI